MWTVATKLWGRRTTLRNKIKPSIGVIGLGVVGSSIAAHLAQRGYAVTGFDFFEPPHTFGSSHGENRLFRHAPFEGDEYAKMAGRAYVLWQELNLKTGKELFKQTGALDIAINTDYAQQAYNMADKSGVKAEMLSRKQAQALFPVFNFTSEMEVVYTPTSGIILAEETVNSFLKIAKDAGANLCFGNAVHAIEPHSCTIFMMDETKKAYDFLIVCAGGWVRALVDLPVRIEKRVLGWYPVKKYHKQQPIGVSCMGKETLFYGMSGLGKGVFKLGDHHLLQEEVDPKQPLEVNHVEKKVLDQLVEQYFQGLQREAVKYSTCKYTMTVDEKFIIKRHPNGQNTFVFSPCSGHGFKYAPVFGEIAENLILEKNY